MMFPYLITPWFPTNCDAPPTLKSIMDSICNFGKIEKTDFYHLADGSRETIFDFKYPLTDKVNKKDFEILILNHFMMRRIGYETVTAFKIALSVKLNEIMPIYNKLFDALDGWNIFNDGEVTNRTETGNNTLDNVTNSNSVNTSDRRFSNVPQNQIQDIKDGDYMTDYNYDTVNDNGEMTSNSVGNNRIDETITKSPADKIRIYREFIESRNSIYTMIFKDLDSLFYGLV